MRALSVSFIGTRKLSGVSAMSRIMAGTILSSEAYILEGKVRVTALDTEGGNFIDDLEKGVSCSRCLLAYKF